MSQEPLHLGIALDAAGWHPAAWREPDYEGTTLREHLGLAPLGTTDRTQVAL